MAIPRTVDAEAARERQEVLAAHGAPASRAWAAGDSDFYLAIHKDSLDERWFLSAFLEQYFPGGVSGGAAASLGTRVVSFKRQNDRLYVFDVDDRKASSDLFDPEVLVEAYPIITGFERFQILPGARDYILIDPAAGLNRFGVVGDAFGAGYIGGDYQARRFQVELSFLQRFRQIDDGITYEHVFTGYSDDFLPDPTGGVEPSFFRASGTLGIALRRYSEGDHYTEVEMPFQEHYFRSDPRIVKNQGTTESVAARWDLYPGMDPVVWYLSPQLAELDAELPSVDLVGAVTRGVEGWNDALGFTAFEVQMAGPDDSFADDDKNFVIFDPDPSLGYAFANWRTNPNTGEIRGASIYLGRGWVLDDYFPPEPVDDPADPEELLAAEEKPPVTRLVWDSVPSDPLCVYWAPTYRAHDRSKAMDTAFTNIELIERYLTHIVAHEIGHTLSLRHNFKGSLEPPTSSVMEYATFDDSIATPAPQAYDIAAVQWLYGQSPDLPTQPFCTDGDYNFDPDCAQFDTGADPLTDFHTPDFELIVEYLTDFGLPPEMADVYLDAYAQGLLGYVRAGTPDQVDQAWQTAMDRFAAPIDPALVGSTPYYAGAADAIATWVLQELYLADPATRGLIQNDPYDPTVQPRVTEQAGQILANVDGIRSYASRRTMVDLLETLQTTEAYLALVSGRDAVETQLADPAVSPQDAALLADLAARIDAAITPYFD